MGHLLLKPRPEEDFYVIWSSVVDCALKVGTKTELLTAPKFTIKSFVDFKPSDGIWIAQESTFQVADEFGAAYEPGDRAYFEWDSDETLFVCLETHEGSLNGDVNRDNFPKLIELIVECWWHRSPTIEEAKSIASLLTELEAFGFDGSFEERETHE